MLGWTVSLSTCGNSASGPNALRCKTRLAEKTWVYQDLRSTIWELTKLCQPLPNILGSLFTLSWGHNEWRTVLWSDEYLDTRFPRPQGSIHPHPWSHSVWGSPEVFPVHRDWLCIVNTVSCRLLAVLQVRPLAGGVWEFGFWNIPQIIIILCAWAYIVCTNNVILDENLIFFREPAIFTAARQRMPMWPAPTKRPNFWVSNRFTRAETSHRCHCSFAAGGWVHSVTPYRRGRYWETYT